MLRIVVESTPAIEKERRKRVKQRSKVKSVVFIFCALRRKHIIRFIGTISNSDMFIVHQGRRAFCQSSS